MGPQSVQPEARRLMGAVGDQRKRVGAMDQAVMQKWEYKVEELNSSRMEEALARLGNDGWELVNVTGGGAGDSSGPVKTLRRKNESFRAFFKRPAF